MLSIAGGVLEAVSSPTFAFANGITRAAGTMITSAIKSATVIKSGFHHYLYQTFVTLPKKIG